MTTGTTAEFLELPEDINPPKPGYFHDVFHLVHAYIELLKHIGSRVVPECGLIKLYGHRTGTLELDTTLIEQTYRATLSTSVAQQTQLRNFALSSISYNVQMLYQLITNTLTRDILNKFGDDKCLSGELMHRCNQFSKFRGEIDTAIKPLNIRIQRDDSIESLVESCHYNAIYPHPGVTSSQAILRLICVLDKIVKSGARSTPEVPGHLRLLSVLKIVFYIGCRYYHLNLLRFSDEIIKRSYDRYLNITDLTLAAVPFDPMLILSCSDETSFISKWGIEYIQSLETVLLYFGGVRYSATFNVEANGNKGIYNV